MAELTEAQLDRQAKFPRHHCKACELQQHPPGDCWNCGQPLEVGSLRPDAWFWDEVGAYFEHGEPVHD